jgi:hypothetical protein
MLDEFDGETESKKIRKDAVCKGFLSRKNEGSANTNKQNSKFHAYVKYT